MWTFLLSFLFLRRFGLSRPIRIALAVFMIGLIVVVFIYTVGLFIDLEERTNAHYAFTYSIH